MLNHIFGNGYAIKNCIKVHRSQSKLRKSSVHIKSAVALSYIRKTTLPSDWLTQSFSATDLVYINKGLWYDKTFKYRPVYCNS